jgi:hypothetical protein
MIGHLKINRAIATRYDKLARSVLDALHIAAHPQMPTPGNAVNRAWAGAIELAHERAASPS